MRGTGEPAARRARLVLVAAALSGAVVCVGLGFAGATLFGGAGSDDRPPVVVPTGGGTSAPVPDGEPMTPEKAKKITLPAPTGQKDGVSTFTSDIGPIPRAVYFWEEYAWLDDYKARQQLEAVTSPGAVGYVDEQISEIRKLREGLGLPPSGGVPPGLTLTTAVHAVRAASIPAPGREPGSVVQIWMSYDRYATGPDGGPDKHPLRGEADDLVLAREADGTWKLTDQYDGLRTFPVAYVAESPIAWDDGWVQVRHAE
ncbi:hypothetical protein ACWFQ8_28235 [Streptomyces sp. NPDC055254]